ncbi:MAG: hypothetical protein IK076_00495 [Bacteroidales bacterium]|nr:hypothetical protein [Bacteroidales bacterium]
MNDFILTLMLLGALSSGNGMPFWSTANRFGIMPEGSGGVAWIGASTEYDPSKALQWRWGASMAAGMNTISNNVMLDQLYGSLRFKMFSLDLGLKHREQGFLAGGASLGSLSTTAGNIVWSGNSRSLPGYSLNLEPWEVPFTGGRIVLSGSYGDYRTIDTRYIEGALVHNTRIGLTIHLTDRLDFLGRLDHYALWGGTHPLYGKRPSGLGNYIRVVTGSSGGSDATVSDQINVLGDQRGAELFGLRWKGEGWNLTFQHDIPYDDGSGMGFQNFPDGVNTLHFGLEDKTGLVSDVLLEYATTTWQSGTRHDWTDSEGNKHISGGGDNYFNNGEYHSGWTFFGRTAGVPLFFPYGTRSGTWNPSGIVQGVENNRLKAIHLGMAGMLFKKAPYKLMLTHSRNFGLYRLPYEGESAWDKEPGSVKETPVGQLSAAFMGEVPLGGLSILYGLYADKGSVLPDTFGATLGLRWKLSLVR